MTDVQQDVSTNPNAGTLADPTAPAMEPPNQKNIEPATKPSHVPKRLIVTCDGTWQDGIDKKYRWQYSNILKLARAIKMEDDRNTPPTPQIVFYQSGIGSENNLYSEFVEGAFGQGLADKVEEAYAFIANNYCLGDEIFLIGFSRGAYTARMVADFIGAIGILDKTQMDHFAEIFLAYQAKGKKTKLNPEQQTKNDELLKRFAAPTAPGKVLTESTHRFSIKCVAVFDTVGSVGLPGEINPKSRTAQLFGFNNHILGTHIERAFQALALNEMREDFMEAKFEQSEEGKAKGQALRQCWFSGSHSDVGGGYEFHDLADITLSWTTANLTDLLAIDLNYLMNLIQPSAPYGAQVPHDSAVGVFKVATSKLRPPPVANDPITHETIHPSVLNQQALRPDIAQLVNTNPEVLWKLLPYEEEVQKMWPYNPETAKANTQDTQTAAQWAAKEEKEQASFLQMAGDAAGKMADSAKQMATNVAGPENTGSGVKVVPQKSWTRTILEDIGAAI